MAASHVNIGNVLDDMGNPEEALVELKKGLDVLVSVTATSIGLGGLDRNSSQAHSAQRILRASQNIAAIKFAAAI